MRDFLFLSLKAIRIIRHRLRTQGWRVTLLWLYGRGIPLVVGIPVMRYSQITPQIYVGAQFGMAGKRKLEALGVSGCVNLRIEYDDAAHGLALGSYCYLPTVDDNAPSLEHLNEGAAFIEEIIATGGKVYIHCHGGVGRAPTMAAAYLITQGFTLDEAVKLIKKSRPFIDINPAQRAQLEAFETAYLADKMREMASQ